LGHSGSEVERLQVQARLIGPITKRIFQEAGIAPGMRVLDVGSGAGEVIGVDGVPTATQQRVRARSVRERTTYTFGRAIRQR
jgi:hypothetical protein